MKNYKEIQRLTEDMCNVSVNNIDAAFNIGYKQGYMDGKEAKQHEYATALHDVENTYIKGQEVEYQRGFKEGKEAAEEDMSEYYNKHFNDVVHSSNDDAYQRGYKDGMQNPSSMGYQHGYEVGLQHGQELRVAEADCAYQCGMKRAWEAARKIYDIQNVAMVKELFGADANYTIHNFTASEAIEKIEAWEKKQNEKRCKNCGHHRSGDVGCEAGGCSLIRENWIPQEKP